MIGQLSFATMNGEIEADDLVNHVGERVHNYDDPENWLHPEEAPDEFVTIEAVNPNFGEFILVRVKTDKGKTWEIAYSKTTDHTHMWRI